MAIEYQLNELTSSHDAFIILIKANVDVTEWTLRDRLRKGIYKGQKIGPKIRGIWYILTSELDRIIQQEAKE